jgi:hypothetical protein
MSPYTNVTRSRLREDVLTLRWAARRFSAHATAGVFPQTSNRTIWAHNLTRRLRNRFGNHALSSL